MLLLTTHGILHLLGYDHAEPEEKEEMFGLQRELLTGFTGKEAPPRRPSDAHCSSSAWRWSSWRSPPLLTAAEAAFNFLPAPRRRRSCSCRAAAPRSSSILDQPVAHMRALRFWRIWFEMASAVAVAVLLYSLLDNVWLAGLAATGIMALAGLRDRGRFAAPAGPASHSAAVVRFTAPVIRFLTLGPRTHPGLARHAGQRRGPGRAAAGMKPSSARRNSANWWTAPPNRT